MEKLLTTVAIDGTEFSVGFEGFHAPMDVQVSYGQEVRFRPWTCRNHLLALKRRLSVTSSSVHIDEQGMAMDVMKEMGLKEQYTEELAPIALWWAAGGGEYAEPHISPEGWLALDNRMVQLRAWTFEERQQALTGNLMTELDGRTRFNLAGYLVAMLNRSVISVDPTDLDIWNLDSAATAILLDAAVSINVPGALLGHDSENSSTAVTMQSARDTLEICRYLGWTPCQVSSMPAPEIDKILDLLHLAEADHPASQTKWDGLAANPDAIVIQVVN